MSTRPTTTHRTALWRRPLVAAAAVALALTTAACSSGSGGSSGSGDGDGSGGPTAEQLDEITSLVEEAKKVPTSRTRGRPST